MNHASPEGRRASLASQFPVRRTGSRLVSILCMPILALACAPSGGADDADNSNVTPGGPSGGGPSASGSAPSGSGSAPSGSGAASGTGGGGGGGGGTITVPPTVLADDGTTVDCETLKRPPTPLRRLTRFEYNNTVRDLLGTNLLPAEDFPPDEVADGYTNNALVLTVSGLHAEKYTYAAETLAAEAVSHLTSLVPCDPATGDATCAKAFIDTFGKKAFRRALDDGDRAALLEAYGYGDSFSKGIEIVIRAALQSPHFLFRVEFTGASTPGAGMVRLNPFETATRLSYLLWSSQPDDALLEAASLGNLDSADDVAREARRMLEDVRAKNAVAEFYRQWLSLSKLETVSKDPAAFPLWSEAMRKAMIDESNAVIESVIFSDDATLKRLLTAPLGLPTGPLASLYNTTESDTLVELPSSERAGVLTLPGFMAVKAHPDQTSPVLRGKMIRTKLLCGVVDPPPDTVDISTPSVTDGATARDRFSAHSGGFCAECHQLMDPLGYPFEMYDSMGAYRTTEGGQTLDLSGEFVDTSGIDGTFVGAIEMTTKLATAPEGGACVANQWYQYANGRGPETGDSCSLAPLRSAFSASGYNLHQLLVDTTQTEVFLYRQAEPAP
jgi:hypothetical protein